MTSAATSQYGGAALRFFFIARLGCKSFTTEGTEGTENSVSSVPSVVNQTHHIYGYPAVVSRRNRAREKLNRFCSATSRKNARLRMRVLRLAFHRPASTVTTAWKRCSGGLGLKNRSRNCGV